MDVKQWAKDLIDRMPIEGMTIKYEPETQAIGSGYEEVRSVYTITLVGPVLMRDTRIDQ